MRRLFVAAAMLLSAAASATESNTFQLRNANDLLRACSVPANHVLYNNAMGFCHGVLYGAFGYYDLTVASDDRFICVPDPTPTRAAVMDGFVEWARANPQYMDDTAIDTLFRYLGATYPCE